MANTDNAGVAPGSLTVDTGDLIDVDRLSQLLSAASANVDSDIVATKACIKRAEELLGKCSSGTRQVGREERVPRGGLAPWRKIRVAAYVEAHLGSQIRVSDLSRVVGLSTGHFFRAFRESFGEAPLAYVARQRIRRSQTLMLSTRSTLGQIGLDCGLFDQPHFTRVFRRIVGLNPSTWRRQFDSSAVRASGVS
jgi:AraC family transcriptional regulator